MPNVVIVTTMWSKVIKEEGTEREAELEKLFWKDMVDDGCSIDRFEDTRESAWAIVDSLADRSRARVLLPREIVDTRLRLNETQAGIALNKELEKLIKDQQKAARRLRKLAKNQDNELAVQQLNVQKANLEENIRKTADQLREMKIPFTRRVLAFFRGQVSSAMACASSFWLTIMTLRYHEVLCCIELLPCSALCRYISIEYNSWLIVQVR